ncbi:MAG: TetR/AcrR family transcriptional regulator [Acidobacteriota bacterium]
MLDASAISTRILEAAAEEFGREGFAGAKVEAIARRAGVNKAGLYYHVGNKEKLYEAVLLHLFGQVAGTLEQAAAPEATPAEALAALTAALADLFSRLPVLPRIMALEMASGAANMPAAALAEFRRIFSVTRGILARGQAAGLLEPAEPVFVHLTLVGSMIVYCLSEPLRRRFAAAAKDMGMRLDMPLTDLADFLARVVGRGLARVDAPQMAIGGEA